MPKGHKSNVTSVAYRCGVCMEWFEAQRYAGEPKCCPFCGAKQSWIQTEDDPPRELQIDEDD